MAPNRVATWQLKSNHSVASYDSAIRPVSPTCERRRAVRASDRNLRAGADRQGVHDSSDRPRASGNESKARSGSASFQCSRKLPVVEQRALWFCCSAIAWRSISPAAGRSRPLHIVVAAGPVRAVLGYRNPYKRFASQRDLSRRRCASTEDLTQFTTHAEAAKERRRIVSRDLTDELLFVPTGMMARSRKKNPALPISDERHHSSPIMNVNRWFPIDSSNQLDPRGRESEDSADVAMWVGHVSPPHRP